MCCRYVYTQVNTGITLIIIHAFNWPYYYYWLCAFVCVRARLCVWFKYIPVRIPQGIIIHVRLSPAIRTYDWFTLACGSVTSFRSCIFRFVPTEAHTHWSCSINSLLFFFLLPLFIHSSWSFLFRLISGAIMRCNFRLSIVWFLFVVFTIPSSAATCIHNIGNIHTHTQRCYAEKLVFFSAGAVARRRE